MSDFTDGDVFANYLSSFWSQMFLDDTLSKGVADGFARQLSQHYQDFFESVNSTSVGSIPALHTELAYPIILKESALSSGPKILAFGEGAVFGPQPYGNKFKEGETLRYGEKANLAPVYYAGLPSDVVSLGNVVVNRLYNPSVVLVNGADFAFEDGVVVFRENPFTNDLIAKRLVPGDSDETVDREIVLWSFKVQTEQFQLHQHYGHLFFDKSTTGELARKAIESIFKLYSGGPSISRLDSFIAAASGFPVSGETKETVTSISALGSDQVIATDMSVYRIASGLTIRSEIVVGYELIAGEPLTTATEVVDRFSKPLWWSSLPGLTIDSSFIVSDVSNLGFLNAEYPVELDGSVEYNGDTKPIAKFYLVGSQKSVDAFWETTRQRSLDKGEFLGEILWKHEGAVLMDGSPDYSIPIFTNPLRLLNDLIGDNTIVVSINAPLTGPLIGSLKILRESIPAYCALIVLISTELSDEFLCTGSTLITSLPFVDGQDLIINDTASFGSPTTGYWEDVDVNGDVETQIPEALSLSYSPSILTDTLDYGNAASYGESVVGRSEPIC